MMTASDATDSLITFASAFFFSALAVDAVISCTMMAPFSCATTSVFSFSRTSILIASTSLAASRSLSSPVLIESARTCTKSSFFTYTPLYSSMNPRKDLGVTYVLRR